MPVNMVELTLKRMLGYLTQLACYARNFARKESNNEWRQQLKGGGGVRRKGEKMARIEISEKKKSFTEIVCIREGNQ